MALTDQIIAYWKLDDVNDSVGSNTLTNNGSVAFNAGIIGNAADLGAVNITKWLSSTSNSSIGNANYTISFWTNITTAIPGATNYQLVNVGNSTNNLTYTIYYKNNGTDSITFGRVRDGVVANEYSFTDDLGTGTWFHIAVTYDGTTVQGYVNGSAAGGGVTSSGNGSSGTVNGVTLGASVYDNGQKLSGLVDEVGLWTRALSAAEISQLYNGGAGLTYPFTSSAAAFLPTLLLLNVG